MRRVTLLAVLVAFAFSCGAQWTVLQCVAWTNMVREYSEMVPLSQAIKMTFSGQYPCGLCKAISQKRQEENAKIFLAGNHEKKVVCSILTLAAPFTASSARDFDEFAWSLQTRAEAPPVPPPRLA